MTSSRPASLLDLAAAITGREIAFDRIRLRSPTAEAALVSLVSDLLVLGGRAAQGNFPPVTCRAQDDGSLVVHSALSASGSAKRVLRIAAGDWDELPGATGSHPAHPMTDATPVLTAAVHARINALHLHAAQRTPRSAVVVFDRSEQGLLSAQDAATRDPALRTHFDDWLAGSAPLFVLARDIRDGQSYTAEVGQLADLTGPGLPYFAGLLGDSLATAVLIGPWLDDTSLDALSRRWREVGGAFPTP